MFTKNRVFTARISTELMVVLFSACRQSSSHTQTDSLGGMQVEL